MRESVKMHLFCLKMVTSGQFTVTPFMFYSRYCVLLITGEDEAFLPGNKAFVDFATVNKKDILRFAYVYQRQQQPLCQALLLTQAAAFPQVGSHAISKQQASD